MTVKGDTLPDIVLDGSDCQDAYALSGIAVGVSIIVQNKSSDNVQMLVKATKPLHPTKEGILIPPLQSVTLVALQSGCWLCGFGRVNVRVAV